ncbi:uncharacterized protein LOC111293324 isoform X2 [Durio zibethinus]|uniref:Uncharacterized protein LOC111293324 isoform X2 n=1 Tax=Durio zibethinus TaxID=66656 RepID=A0A6P5YNH1_DURZI|nr:uncharacterized protein LOC111293324 isoform X2 [Durio zibethinus]
MESTGGSGLDAVGCAIKKKRSSISRRPRVTQQTFTHNYILISTPTPAIGSGGNEDQNFKNGSNGFGSENKLKLKLKLGGVTRMIRTQSTADPAFGGVPDLTKSSYFSDAPQTQEKSFFLDNKGSYLSDKGEGYGVQWKDFSRHGSDYGKGYSSRGKAPGAIAAVNETDRNEPTRKSKRIPKRRVLDVGINSDDEDEEIRYLGRLNASNGLSNYKDEEDERKERDSAIFEDGDYVEEDEPISDGEPGFKRKKLGRVSIDLFVEGRTESTPTTRNRALQSGKDLLSGPGASLVEFPDGLPPAPPKKQKEKLSEVAQQLKKAEAAQRRRMQSEKAAREAEAEAIRKILGQDSGRKKREEKIKKQRDELAQGKAAKFESLASNTVRWVIRPDGTTVIFSEDMGLPKLFNSVPCRYSCKSICLVPFTTYTLFLVPLWSD